MYLAKCIIPDLLGGPTAGYPSSVGRSRRRFTTAPSLTNLGIRSRGQALYLEIMESRRGLRATGQVGLLDALHSTALCKAMRSQLPEEDLGRVVRQAILEKRTQFTETDRKALLRAIGDVRTPGHAIDDQENEVGMRCVAAPIINADGWPLGALSISGPTSRMTPEAVTSLGTQLRESCELIASRLAEGNATGQ